MTSPLKILGLIPARGGSKGVPRKNIRPLAGKPLLAYTAEAALASTKLTQVLLSTDDSEIAEVGRALGLAVPFLRPAELAQDDTPTLPVVQHAVRALEAQGTTFDAVCLLQPTNPLRTTSMIDDCIELLISSNADCAVTVLPVPPEFNPHWVYFRDSAGHLKLSTGESVPLPRRQMLPPAYHRDGSVYVTRRSVLMQNGSLYGEKIVGLVMKEEHSLNIDTQEDWVKAENRMKDLTR